MSNELRDLRVRVSRLAEEVTLLKKEQDSMKKHITDDFKKLLEMIKSK